MSQPSTQNEPAGKPASHDSSDAGKQRQIIAAILLIALALRLVNAFMLPWQGGELIISDMKGYDRAAMALLEQQPLSVHTAERYLFHPMGSDTYHPPAYYYFLAGIYKLAGHNFLAVRIAQALLDTFTCWLIYAIGRQVFGKTSGMLAAALAAVFPPLIFYTGVLLTETLSTCLLAGATWILLKTFEVSKQASKVLQLALAGLLLGLAALTRSVLLLVVPAAILWLWCVAARWPGWKAAARYALALCLPMALVITPISVRNYQIHHKLILISTNGGVNFFLGHGGNERLKNEIRNIPPDYTDGPLIGISSRTEPQEEAHFYQLGWEYIRQHPLRTLHALPGNLREMYWSSEYWPASDAQVRILRVCDGLWKGLLVLCCAGVLLLRGRHGRRAMLPYGIVLSSISIPLLFWAQTRFRMPFVPSVIVLAAGTAHMLYQRLIQKGMMP